MTARLLLLAAALALIGCSATPIHLPDPAGGPDGGFGLDLGDRQPDVGPIADAYAPPIADSKGGEDVAVEAVSEAGPTDAPAGDAVVGYGDGTIEAGEGGPGDASTDADADPASDAEPDAPVLDVAAPIPDSGADG